MSDTELLPCPFCGFEYPLGGETATEMVITCGPCRASIHGGPWLYPTEESIIKAWNTRTPQRGSKPMPERVIEAVKCLPPTRVDLRYISPKDGLWCGVCDSDDLKALVGEVLEMRAMLDDFCRVKIHHGTTIFLGPQGYQVEQDGANGKGVFSSIYAAYKFLKATEKEEQQNEQV